jgi:hypothetical protein
VSSGAGGEVIGLVVVGAVAGTAVVAAGLVVGAGYCAVGLARGAVAAGRAANEAWEEHEQARALRARALALEERRYAEYLETRGAFEAACTGAGVDPDALVPGPHPSRSAEVAEIQDAIATMSLVTGRLQREARDRAAARRARELTTALERAATTQTRAAAEELTAERHRLDQRAAAREATRASVIERAAARLAAERDAELRARVTRALAELPEGADSQTLAKVEAWGARLPGLSGDQLAQAASDLEVLCGRASSDEALRAQHETVAQGVIAALAGCGTPAAEELLTRARAFLAGDAPWDPDLKGRAKAELDRIQREFDDMWAAMVLASALADLGYEVGQDSAIDMLAGGSVATKDAWPDHGVHVSLDPDLGLTIELVRQGAPDARTTAAERDEDVHVEQQFCRDLDPLLRTAAERGVVVRLDRRVEPGERTLDRADFRGEGRGWRRRDRDARELQMEARSDD